MNENTIPLNILRIIFNLKSSILQPFDRVNYNVLKFQMSKILNIFLLNFLLMSTLQASEPTLAILNSVHSNELQKFKIGQNSFYCKPYAITTIDKLYAKSAQNSLCRSSIEKFYLQNPDAQYFTLNLLKVKQMYHVEFKNTECILFAKGEKTLSELLLENGLALLQINFQDKEYGAIYKKSQNRARLLKRGLWKENIKRECVVELYKE